MKALLESGEFSDLTVTLDQHIFRLHRVIVCPRSTFFASICRGNFKEAASQKIDLHDDDLDSLKRMLYFIYTGEYDDTLAATSIRVCGEEIASVPVSRKTLDWKSIAAQSRSAPPPPPTSSVHVYTIADKYGVSDLKVLAKSRFSAWAEDYWLSTELPMTARDVFESTPAEDKGLREIVAEVLYKHSKDLLHRPDWQEVLEAYPQFATVILSKQMSCCEVEQGVLSKQIAELKAAADLATQRYMSIRAMMDGCYSCRRNLQSYPPM